MMTQYVLLIEHDNRPHDVWVFSTLAAAENFLHEWGEEYFGERFGDGCALVELLAEDQEYARIYETNPKDGSRELTPFAKASASAA